MWWWTAIAFAAPRPIVAVGEGLIADPPAAEARVEQVASVGWVAVLADCLEERRPGAFVVVDRSAGGERPVALAHSAPVVRELAPALVVVGFGAEPTAEITALLDTLRREDGPAVMLVGPLPPSIRREAVLALWTAAPLGAILVDPSVGWPTAPEERARLADADDRLSDPGHARIGAQVCDAVLAWSAPPQ